MSYKSFTDLGLALNRLNIMWVVHTKNLDLYKNLTQEFCQEHLVSPTATFYELFNYGKTIYWQSAKRLEEMRKTRLIWPFLLETERHHPKLRVWEAVSIDADASQDLTGEPDYSISKEDFTPKPPYFVIVEAKQEDFSAGWGQALASMKGAQLMNKNKISKDITIYGAVTTGDEWQFGKLQDNQFVIYPKDGIKVLENDEKAKEVLSLLDTIFEISEKNI